MASDVGEIYIGRKPTMNYVLATVLQFNQGKNQVIIKARGKSISKAVDVAEITRNRFLQNVVEVDDVKIGTESLGGGESEERNVSVIEITLKRVA